MDLCTSGHKTASVHANFYLGRVLAKARPNDTSLAIHTGSCKFVNHCAACFSSFSHPLLMLLQGIEKLKVR